MTIHPAPAPAAFAARWFHDGAPVGEAAEAHVGPGGVTIRTEARLETWPLADLRLDDRPRRGEPVRIGRASVREMIVCEDHAILGALARAAPEQSGRWRSRPGPPIVAVALGSLVAALVLIAVLVAFGVPALARGLSASVPIDWEERFGASVVAQAAPEARRIADPRVTEAVDRIVARLAGAPPRSPYTFRVVVVDAPEVNAFAAPGGHLAVHRGLIEFARTPEELAGVLAHEMTHVNERHVTRALLQRASLGILVAIALGDAGGPAAALGQALGELSYGREAELEADALGLDRLVAAGVDPRGMPDFLARMAGDAAAPKAALEFLSTHPGSETRARRLRERVAGLPPGGSVSRPVLAEAEWNALRAALSARSGAASPASGAPR